MKKIFALCLSAAIVFVSNAQPPAGEAKPGDWYGEKVVVTGAVPITEVAQKLTETDKIETKFTAKVLDVCPKKGCWIKLQVGENSTAFVKMKDYGFFVPLAAIGKTVVIDGELKIKTTSVAELKHYAEDAKKSKEEIDAITKPEKEIRVMAKGITVVE
jgi:DNA-directed RNA polymerase subunit F